MSKPLFDQIRDLVNAEIDSFNFDKDHPEFEGDATFTMLPTADGPALAVVVVIATKGVLLGQGRIVSATVDIDPIRLLDDSDRVRNVVLQAVHQVREMRSQALGQFSGGLVEGAARG